MWEIAEFDWEVLEVTTDPEQRGCRVLYTPTDQRMSAIEMFVPVPWHKLPEQAYALEIMEKKIRQRAPRNRWQNEIMPPIPDNSAEIAQTINDQMKKMGELPLELLDATLDEALVGLQLCLAGPPHPEQRMKPKRQFNL